MTSIHFPTVLLLLFILHTASQSPTSINLVMDEESALRTTIGNITSHLFPRSKITVDSHFFAITPSGSIQVADLIDLETLCADHSLCCQRDQPCLLTSSIVIEGDEHSRDVASLELNVEVRDVNDNAPAFTSGSEQSVSLSELAEVGTLVQLSPAVDADVDKANQIQRYAVRGESLQRNFDLESSGQSSGGIRLRLLRPLDFEEEESYSGILEACDRQSCVQQNLSVRVLDVNDNQPKFVKRSYELTIPENFSVGHTIIQLEAVDADSAANAKMWFNFDRETDANVRKTLRIDAPTGRVILQSRLTANRRSEYRFRVGVGEGTGSGSSDTFSSEDMAEVVITIADLNDHSPSIRLISPGEGELLAVTENSQPPTRICILQVTDDDLEENGRVTCRLLSSSIGGLTSIDSFELKASSAKLYTLFSTRPFDAESSPQLTVSVVCTDHGSPNPRSSSRDLVVQVLDVNESPPRLEKSHYYTEIKENAPTGLNVVQIRASDQDRNATIHYDLDSAGSQYFTIDPNSGLITTLGSPSSSTFSWSRRDFDQTSSGQQLDREKTEKIIFKVCISDGKPTRSCALASGRSGTADQDSDVVVHTVTATVTVSVLDENDNYPKFISKGPFSVGENQARLSQVEGRLEAVDPDAGENGAITYSLRRTWIAASESPVGTDLFQVDEHSGELRTLAELDRETTNAYGLELEACDSNSQSPLCTPVNVTVELVDANDNQPEWHYPHERDNEVNITADLPQGHLVARVLAMDRDAGPNGRVVYSLIDPNRRTVFEIDNTTGEILVSRSPHSTDDQQTLSESPSDSSITSPLLPGVYKLRLRATDMGQQAKSSETWLLINAIGTSARLTGGLNFLIIVVMIGITAIISVCLVVAIVCVRRRSSGNRRRGSPNDLGRSRADGTDFKSTALQHPTEFPYRFDDCNGGGYMIGVSPTPSDLVDTLKLSGYHHQYHPTSLSNGSGVNGPIPDAAAVGLLAYDPIGYYPHPQSSAGAVDIATDALGRQFQLVPTGASPCTNCCTLLPPSGDSNDIDSSSASVLHSFTAKHGMRRGGGVENRRSPCEHVSLNGSGGGSVRLLTPNDQCVVPGDENGSLGPHQSTFGCSPANAVFADHHQRYLAPSANGGGLVLLGPSQVAPPPTTTFFNSYELDVESADSGRGTSEDDPQHLTNNGPIFYRKQPPPQLVLHDPSVTSWNAASTLISPQEQQL